MIMFISPWNTHFFKRTRLNPVNHDNDQMNQAATQLMMPNMVYVSGEKYSLKENDLIKNVPLSQIKNVFKNDR